jgi:hypothetical protein
METKDIQEYAIQLIKKNYNGIILKDKLINYTDNSIDCKTNKNHNCKYDIQKIIINRFQHYYNINKSSTSSKKSSSSKKLYFSSKKSSSPKIRFNKRLFDFKYTDYNIDYYKEIIYNPTHPENVWKSHDVENIKAIYFCYFHINDFDIKSLDIKKNIENEILVNQIRTIQKKDKKGIIKTEQQYVELSNIQQMQQLQKFKPLHVSCEEKNKLYLADGNHRLITLKMRGYNGFVPVLMFDWMEDGIYFEKENKKRKYNSK